jgi:hypothetical protein
MMTKEPPEREGVLGTQDPPDRVMCPPERRERTAVLLIARRHGKERDEQEQVRERGW